jgi:hypothetical protein
MVNDGNDALGAMRIVQVLDVEQVHNVAGFVPDDAHQQPPATAVQRVNLPRAKAGSERVQFRVILTFEPSGVNGSGTG